MSTGFNQKQNKKNWDGSFFSLGALYAVGYMVEDHPAEAVPL